MELVLLLPFFVLMLLAVVQVSLLVQTRLLVTHAAREAVREAAVGGDDSAVQAAATAAADLDGSHLDISVIRSGNRVTVRLEYADHTDVPLVGALMDDPVFSAEATMRLELDDH